MSRWFRFYDEAMNDTKVLLLPSDTLRWQWVVMLCVASQHAGVIPSLEVAALHLRLKPQKAAEVIGRLASAGLLDKDDSGYFQPHNWSKRQFKSDADPTSAERQKRFRERHRNALHNGTHNADETRTETEAYSEADTDQQSLTSLQITTSEGQFVGDVKKRRPKPRHCAVSRDKKHVYIETNTPEWEAYAADFRAIHMQEPQPNSDGGKWFSAQGEAA